ncbi:MAG: GNAT family N-acetyltransferase [Clostridia bacterium]|nr:GNAT family N-acetyltransferase [Clostridia bacterium]
MDDRKYRKVFRDLPVLQTDRLYLRKISPEDLFDMYEYASEDEVSRYLLWSPHLNIAETRGHIEFLQKQYRKGQATDWGVALKASNKLIGTCGFANVDLHNNKAEIGYVLSHRHRGKGYMREAVRRVLALGFGELGLNRIEARILEGNTRSERLAESVGMRLEGTLKQALLIKGKYKTFSYYAITAEDYYEGQATE